MHRLADPRGFASASVNSIPSPGSVTGTAIDVQGRRVCLERSAHGCTVSSNAALTPTAQTAAHQQTRVLFNRFIPSASATRSPFSNTLTNSSPLPPPTLAPEGELTPEKVDEHIAGAFEIAEFLKKNVVQGVRTDEGNYCGSYPYACGAGAAAIADTVSSSTLRSSRRFTCKFPLYTDDSSFSQLSGSTKKPSEATTTRSRRKPRSRPRSRTSTCAGGDGERATRQRRRPPLRSRSAAVVAERRTPQHSMGEP